MMNRFIIDALLQNLYRRISNLSTKFIFTISLITIPAFVLASGFQLWELDAVSIGDYHAGYAAIAEDASTTFNNPAGLIRLKNQEILAGASGINTNFQANGTIQVSIAGLPPGPIEPASAQGGGFNFVPFGYYAIPLNKKIVFGMGILIPFGLKTNYGDETMFRYSAMLSSIKVIDYTPALGLALNDAFSVGIGLDAEHMSGEFSQTVTADITEPNLDTTSYNSASNTLAFGYHVGLLYQPLAQTRIGLTYHSQVVHHLNGKSTFTGPLAHDGEGGSQVSNNLNTTITLPPFTSLSLFHAVTPKWDIMGSISYVQWDVIQAFVFNNVAGILDSLPNNQIPVVIQTGYHNSWNYSVGTNLRLNDQWLFRGGVGYDQTPTTNQYRNLQLPDCDRIAVAIGAHYQIYKNLGLDAGWTHIFAVNTSVNNVTQVLGDEITVTNAHVRASANVYALQMRLSFA